MDERLIAGPRVFDDIRAILESARIVGGSTATRLEAPLFTRIGHALATLPKAWITGYDHGVAFCRRVDFNSLPLDVRRAVDQQVLLHGLRYMGRKTKRVLTRLPTAGVIEKYVEQPRG